MPYFHSKSTSFISNINHKKYSIFATPDLTYWPTHIKKHPDISDILVANIPVYLHNDIINLLKPWSDHTLVLLFLNAQLLPILTSQPRERFYGLGKIS